MILLIACFSHIYILSLFSKALPDVAIPLLDLAALCQLLPRDWDAWVLR